MNNQASLYKLLTWMSPGYPIGAFTYSHGLEMAIEDGRIEDSQTLENWLSGLLSFGSIRNDGIFLTHAYKASDEELLETIDLALAYQASSEFTLETVAQGKAFVRITDEVWSSPRLAWVLSQRTEITHPVALGIAAADHGVPLNLTLTAYLHGFVSNLVSAAVRIVPLGQTDGQRAIQRLETQIEAVQSTLLDADLNDLGTFSMISEICSMRHETQYTRLFRS